MLLVLKTQEKILGGILGRDGGLGVFFILRSYWSGFLYHAKEFGFLPKGLKKCDGGIFACGR